MRFSLKRAGISIALLAVGLIATLLIIKGIRERSKEETPWQLDQRLVELYPVSTYFDSPDQIVMAYRVTNLSEEPYVCEMMHEWYGRFTDAPCLVYEGKAKLPDGPGVQMLRVKFKQTHLKPGESVTVCFFLKSIARLPESENAERVFFVETLPQMTDIKLKRVLIARGRAAVVVAKERPDTPRIRIRQITTDKEAQQAKVVISLTTVEPADKLAILKLAADSGRKDILWSLIAACDETYATVEVLRNLPPKLCDEERLVRLLSSKDLAVRREAINTLGRLGKDEVLAAKLEQFLETQKDEPTLEYGRAALKKLRGK